eukprot:gene13516-4397_t
MTVSGKKIAGQGEDDKNPWELIEVIGKGTYGEVYKGRNKNNGSTVAVKVTEFNQNKNEELKTELAVLEKYSKHDNIIKFIDAQFLLTLSGTEQLWIITEYCEYGSVSDFVKNLIQKGRSLDESLIALILSEVLKGLQYLHDCNVVHRDIKGSNILLKADAGIKLIDFGVSTVLQSSSARCRSSVGTPFWMAPEVIACEQQLDYCYDGRCDVWSLGITAIELADGDPPLVDQHPMRALFSIPRSPPPTVKRPEKWTGVFLDFISRSLVKDFEKRPFVKELIEHSFIAEIQRKTVLTQRKLLALLKLNNPIDELYSQQTLDSSSSYPEILPDVSTKSKMAQVTNLAELENLNEDTILDHLRERYAKNHIYTYIGDILIAVNPFKHLEIYNEKVARQYQALNDKRLRPHVYQVARSAHLAVLHKNKNQCCVISGESGAGKTVNPLMEAFGNAATNINENSSRFGKFLELSFTHTGDLIEGILNLANFFLKNQELFIKQGKGERNFHILYYLIAGLDYHRKLGSFDLNSNDQHRYLNTDDKTLDQFACTPQMQEHFLAIQKCFDIIGFSQEEVQSLYCILAAVIHLGDIEIVADDSMSMTHHGERGSVQNTEILNTVASLLCVRPEDLSDAITSASAVTRGETILRYNNVEQSSDCRDAIAKALYSRLFSWIVKRINILLGADDITSPRTIHKKIGILDIFGFENFDQNSFEQLCINIANEQLQFYFNQHVFEWEFEEYASEGIPLETITFQNNRAILEMFLQRPMGILALLDEESRFPRATVLSLVEKFCDNMSKGYFRKPKDSTSNFVINHYAGQVTYDAAGFLEKNRDTLSSDVMQLLRTSDDRLVRTIFQGSIDSADDSKRRGSISSNDSYGFKADFMENKRAVRDMSTSKLHLTMSLHFRNSLRSLMAKMIHADPHFIRCIRPNSKNIPDVFDDQKVTTQLRYTGVLETSQIRRQGYSERIPFGDFVHRYKCLVYHLDEDPPRDANTCRNILKNSGMETDWRIGKTKVFLKYFQITKLAELLEQYRRNAVRVQRYIRGWLARRYYAYMKGEIDLNFRRKEEEREVNAVRIQSGPEESNYDNNPAVRGYLARKRFKKLTEERDRELRQPNLMSFHPVHVEEGNDDDDDSVEDTEGQTALQDTKMFFFLAQIQMSTADSTSLLHRTNYPVLYSLRRDATEKAKKEAISQKIGSRERVLAVLDGTDDTIQSKYRWAREQFETKSVSPRPMRAKREAAKQPEAMSDHRDAHSEASRMANGLGDRPYVGTGQFVDRLYERSDLSTLDDVTSSRGSDRLLSNYKHRERSRKSIKETPDGNDLDDNVWRKGQRSGYPLRSLVEKNANKETRKHEPSTFTDFEWFPTKSSEIESNSYLARETAIPTDEMVHRNVSGLSRAIQSGQKLTSQQGESTNNVFNPYDHRPYSYLQNAQPHRGKKEIEKPADTGQRAYPNGIEEYGAGRSGLTDPVIRTNSESLKDSQRYPDYENDRKHAYLKEKGLRDPLNRVLPRTDVAVHERDRKDENDIHQGMNGNVDSSNSLASQIANHLAAQKAKEKAKQSNGVQPQRAQSKAVHPKEHKNANGLSLTSMENKSKLKQANGFSYGVPKGQKGLLQNFNLRKTGRLQMLVQH